MQYQATPSSMPDVSHTILAMPEPPPLEPPPAPRMLDDQTSLTTIRRFLSAPKPAELNPIDIALMVHLMSRKSEDHGIWDSQLTLAKMFNTDARTIARSMERLEEIGYIHQHHRRGRTSLVSIKFENVPAEDVMKLKITEDARFLATKYQQRLMGQGRKKFPSPWFDQQRLNAQRLLNECDGDLRRAASIVKFALDSPKFKKKAGHSIYNVMLILPKIIAAQQKEIDAMQALQSAKQHPAITPEIGAVAA